MEPNALPQLPVDPLAILLQALEHAGRIVVGFPWTLKLLLTAGLLSALFSRRKPGRPDRYR